MLLCFIPIFQCAHKNYYEVLENGKVVYSKYSDGESYEYTRDDKGNILSYKDSDGYSYEKTYDGKGNELTYKDSVGDRRECTYDENGEYTKMVKLFPCAVGRSARMTALGSFEISSKGAWKRWNSGQFSPYYTKYTAGVYIHGPIFSK